MTIGECQIQSISIAGAGIIGLSCALELADRGLDVALYEPQWPPRGASWAAAGMLAPAYEAAATPGTHPDLFQLCFESSLLWPKWAANLERRSGRPSGYQPGPTLALASNDNQASHLSAIEKRLSSEATAPQRCLSRLPAIEPAISEGMTAALLLPSDGQADNRLTLEALASITDAHPRIRVLEETLPLSPLRAPLTGGAADAVLVTAGWESGDAVSEVEPYGGQLLSVTPIPDGPKMAVRCGDLYIVPKHDRIVIGATTEPGRRIYAAEPEIVENLLSRAIQICPPLARADIIETWAGIRPGTKDHAPILGETATPNVFVATGHYRNGVLLAPITAQIMADMIVSGETSMLAKAFSPKRFQQAVV